MGKEKQDRDWGIRGLDRGLCAGSPGASFLAQLCLSHWVTPTGPCLPRFPHGYKGLAYCPTCASYGFYSLSGTRKGGGWRGLGWRRVAGLAPSAGMEGSLTP